MGFPPEHRCFWMAEGAARAARRPGISRFTLGTYPLSWEIGVKPAGVGTVLVGVVVVSVVVTTLIVVVAVDVSV